MSDNYGPQQGQGGWNQPGPGEQQGWQQGQPQGPQGWQQGQAQGPQGWQQGQPQPPQGAGYQPQGFPQQGQGFPPGSQPGQQGPGHFPGQQGPTGWQPQQSGPVKKRNLGVIITAVVVVLAIAAGVTVWLVSRKGDTTAEGGQANPKAAASDMLQSLSNKDALGVAQQLDPTEAQVFADMSGDILGELKRLQIVKPNISTESLSGSKIKMENLKFDDAKETKVNDHLTIVKLTGGTITISSEPTNLPFTDKMKKALGPKLEQAQPKSLVVKIEDEVAKRKGEPFSIATVKRGDKWYPSLFYTAAQNWLESAQKKNPELNSKELAAPIAQVGAGSPEDAVTGMVDKATKADYEGVIGMLPPDEMGFLYDYGKRMLAAGKVKSGQAPSNMPKISDLKFTTSDVTGGKKVSLQHVTVEADGHQTSVTVDAGAGKVTVEQDGKTQELTSDNVLQKMAGQSSNMPPQVADLVKREFKQMLTVGIVTTEVNGKWFVSPLRTGSGLLLTVLQGLQPADIDFLLSMANR